MGPSVVFSFLMIALCCHGYGALPTVESTTESKSTTPKGQLEAKAGGISVRFGNFEATDGDELMFPGISNRAFGSFGSASSSSPSSSSGSSSSSSSASSTSSSSSNALKKAGGEGIQRTSAVRPGRPAELQRAPASPCQTCCKSNPCGGVPLPYIPDQGAYRPPPPPQFVGSDGYYPDYGGRPYPGFVHGGSGSYSNSQAASSSGYKYGNNGYQHGGNQIFPGYPGGSFGPNHGGNSYYPSRPVGSGSSASSSANSFAGSNNAGYPGHPGYPGVPGFNQPYPGGYSGSFSSSSSSSSAAKGGSFSSSNSQSGSVSGNARPVRPVIPPTVPEVTPEFSLPDGMCRSSGC